MAHCQHPFSHIPTRLGLPYYILNFVQYVRRKFVYLHVCTNEYTRQYILFEHTRWLTGNSGGGCSHCKLLHYMCQLTSCCSDALSLAGCRLTVPHILYTELCSVYHKTPQWSLKQKLYISTVFCPAISQYHLSSLLILFLLFLISSFNTTEKTLHRHHLYSSVTIQNITVYSMYVCMYVWIHVQRHSVVAHIHYACITLSASEL